MNNATPPAAPIDFTAHFLPMARAYYGGAAPEGVVNAKARTLARCHLAVDEASSVEEQAADIAILVAYEATLVPVIIPEPAPAVVYVSTVPAAPASTFRALLGVAVALHREALPLDGCALLLEEAAPCLSVRDSELADRIQRAQAILDGATHALLGIRGGAKRRASCQAANSAYHRAFMAYLGIKVAA